MGCTLGSVQPEELQAQPWLPTGWGGGCVCDISHGKMLRAHPTGLEILL